VSIARGELVMWQDADDISLPGRIEMQVDYLDKNKDVGIVGGCLKIFNESGSTRVRKYPIDDQSLRRVIYRYSPVAQPAAMLRRKCIIEAGGYDLRYPTSEDLDMTFKIAKKYRMANLPDVILMYRETNNGATFTNLGKMERLTLEIRRKYARDSSFNITFWDKLYNLFHRLSIYIVPPKIKLLLFKLIRDRIDK
jgi:hypothetical protein